MKYLDKVSLIYVSVLILGFIFSIQPASHFASINAKEITELFEDKPVSEETIQLEVEESLRGVLGGFVENKGQKEDTIRYYLESQEMFVGFGTGEISFRTSSLNEQTIMLEFIGCNTIPPVVENPSKVEFNYFLGANPEEWDIGCMSYERIVYYNLYDMIDLVYEIKDGQLKYEFFVYPGANPENIKIHWNGPISLDLKEDGIDVKIEELNSRESKILFTDSNPICFQSQNRDIRTIGYFKMIDDRTYGFNMPSYDPTQLLIIDPVYLTYSTFLSGSLNDLGKAIAVDDLGNMYIAGHSWSVDFPVINSVQDPVSNGDVVIIKLSPDGSEIIFASWVGGTLNDFPKDIAIDKYGHIYVAGSTYSDNFPTINAYNDTWDGSGSERDVFVFKMSSDGSTLFYSTYVSGSLSDTCEALVVDDLGTVYAVGQTESLNFPTVNALNNTGDGSTSFLDGFLFRLSSDGSELLFSTYLSGSIWDYAKDVELDEQGNVYVVGNSNSDDFPITSGVFNETGEENGWNDIFVLKMTADGSNLIYSTFVSGSESDTANGIAVDSAGNAYVVGETESSDFPMVNAYNSTHSGSYGDLVIFKLSPSGDSLHYSTFIGGNSHDNGEAIRIDESGNAFILGLTQSTNFPTTPDALDSWGDGSTGSSDVAIMKLSSDGSKLLYSTYISGLGAEYVHGLALDNDGNLYFTGETQYETFPVVNALNSTGDGTASYFDMIVSKLTFYSEPSQPQWLSASQELGQVKLSWGDSEDDGNSPILAYRVYRSTTSGSFDLETDLISETTSMTYVDDGVTLGTEYFYVVTTVNAFGQSEFSDEKSIIPVIEPYAPRPPENLQATPGDNLVDLSWDLPSSDGGSPILRYLVYRGTASGSYEFLGKTENRFYNDTTAAGGTQYFYVLTAENAVGESEFSDETSATPTGSPIVHTSTPSAPQNVDATTGVNSVSLEWDVPSEDGGSSISSYHIYRGAMSGEYFLLGAAKDTSFDDVTAIGGIGYYYVITAINDVGEGEMSDEVSATPETATTTSTTGTPTSLLPIGTDIIALGIGGLALVIALISCRKGKQ
ncbi:MAG: SBBP repeat-containing protein [Candidatus Thorarchaeota archaeon]|jgi:fibronectin type 3 domain-containing protein